MLHASAKQFRFAPSFVLVVVLHFAVFSIHTNTTTAQNSSTGVIDRLALLAIKSMIKDDPQGLMTSWNDSNTNFCRWEGVTCSRRHHRVTVLDLSSGGLTGMLSPSIGNLSFLREIHLVNNSFSGEIPPEIGRLFRVRVLRLQNNSFTGNIPATITNCSNLQVLHLGKNLLVGKIPDGVGSLSMLKFLILHWNILQGGIPPFIANLTLLDTLSFFDCQLGGRFPDVFHQLTKLRRLAFSGNNLVGTIPPSLYNCSSLEEVFLDNNRLEGGIPLFIANLTLLDTLSLIDCQLSGHIPNIFHRLTNLRRLAFTGNNLVGTIPPSLYNCSSLEEVYIDNNTFTGRLPSNLGYTMPRLVVFSLFLNRLTGPLPPSILGSPQLNHLDVMGNNLSGKLVITSRNSCNLEFLLLSGNSFGNEEDDEMKFIDDLSICRKLKVLALGLNQFKGSLPESLGNLSTTLQIMSIASNHFSGGLPSSVGNLTGLTELDLSSNQFTGKLPVTIGNLTNLQLLDLKNNSFSGSIPGSLGNLSLLLELHLTANKFTGTIPSSLGNCKQLLRLNLDQNNLTGDIPGQLFEISSLSISLNLGFNQLSGQLPIDVGHLKNLNEIILANNRLSGNLLSSLGSCSSLQNLSISNNFFSGPFPASLGSLRALENLDVSHNNFTGRIPAYLEVFPLKNLNLSFNDLEGKVSTKGVFANASLISILGNSRLCGGVPELQLPKCQSNKKKNKLSLAVILVISVGSVLFFVVMVLFYACYPWKKKVEDGPQKSTSWEYLSQVSYNTLYNATNGFSTENLIGEGSFSSVYKGCLDTDGVNIVAIKVLNLHHRGGSKSFISECDALRNTRHRNLAKVITCCSGIDFQGNDFKAIVYEFKPNGSLDRWLHNPQSELHQLSLIQRVSIVLDVAYAVDYLHHHAGQTIVHCDLKPSNVLLDEDMVAHLGDFGLSKILQSEYQHRYNSSSAGVRGTIGYAAPEYGVGSKVSKNADTYSFGIMLLEMMTRKKPTDVMFGEELSLHNYAKNAMGDGALEIIDPVLLKDDQKIGLTTNKEETIGYLNHERCLQLLLEIGVSCSMESPQNRMDTASVIKQLQLIKNAILGNSTV